MHNLLIYDKQDIIFGYKSTIKNIKIISIKKNDLIFVLEHLYTDYFGKKLLENFVEQLKYKMVLNRQNILKNYFSLSEFKFERQRKLFIIEKYFYYKNRLFKKEIINGEINSAFLLKGVLTLPPNAFDNYQTNYNLDVNELKVPKINDFSKCLNINSKNYMVYNLLEYTKEINLKTILIRIFTYKIEIVKLIENEVEKFQLTIKFKKKLETEIANAKINGRKVSISFEKLKNKTDLLFKTYCDIKSIKYYKYLATFEINDTISNYEEVKYNKLEMDKSEIIRKSKYKIYERNY